MPRPKGSKNKNKGDNLRVLNFEKQIEGAAITKDSQMGWVKFGQKNNYPNLLLDLYQNSPTHHACINFAVQCIVGEGIDYETMQIDGTQTFPNYQYGWDTLIRYISLDYMLYGSFSVEIIKNKDNKTFSFYHIPYEKVRCAPYDDDGVITRYYISNDWTQPTTNPPTEIEAIDMRDGSKIERGKPYLYVYKNYDPTMSYYQSPSYAAGIKAIQSEVEIINYDMKSTVNGFVPAGMLRLNDVATDEERQAIIANITRLFTGSDNANSLMISFRNNPEEPDPSFTPFATNTGNVNLYEATNTRTINRILAAHQIPSASLVGLPDVGNSGFASDSQKLETAYQLYQKLTGNYNRQNVVKTLNEMFLLNGIEAKIILKPLHFNDFGDGDESSDTNANVNTTQDISTDNIEEKVE